MVRTHIIRAIREVEGTLSSLVLLSTFLDSLLVFLICVVTLMLVSVSWLWAFIPGILYFYYFYKKEKNHITLAFVEEKTPELNEALRTSADNLDKDNEIVLALHEEVLGKMKHINVSDFIDFRKVSRRLIMIAILCFLILIFSAYNVNFIDLEDLINDITHPPSSQSDSPYDEDFGEGNQDQNAGGGGGGSIFGEESIAELGNEALDLQISLVQSEIDINDIGDVQEREYASGRGPDEIAATLDSTGTEDITEHKDLIKKYYKEIALT